MLGSVLHYSVQTGEGSISGDDGRRYSFTSRDWNGPEVPAQGARVESTTTDGQAVSVYPTGPATGRRSGGPSAFPAIAAGCCVGFAIFFVLSVFITLAVGTGLGAISFPRSGTAGIVARLIALAIGMAIGYLVYRAVRNRRG